MKKPGRLPRYTELARGPMKRGKRKASETLRIYGGADRCAFVAQLPCSVMGCGRRPSENCHVTTGGIGRKSDASDICPMCATHHRELHAIGQRTFSTMHRLDLAECARRTAAAWDARGEREC